MNSLFDGRIESKITRTSFYSVHYSDIFMFTVDNKLYIINHTNNMVLLTSASVTGYALESIINVQLLLNLSFPTPFLRGPFVHETVPYR